MGVKRTVVMNLDLLSRAHEHARTHAHAQGTHMYLDFSSGVGY